LHGSTIKPPMEGFSCGSRLKGLGSRQWPEKKGSVPEKEAEVPRIQRKLIGSSRIRENFSSRHTNSLTENVRDFQTCLLLPIRFCCHRRKCSKVFAGISFF
jgi:hypothetical protein